MIQFKIDTKEKFTVVHVTEPHVNDNMAADLAAECLKVLSSSVKNLVLNLQSVESVEKGVAEKIARLQQTFYEQNTSFVICCLQEVVEKTFEDEDLLDFLNITPTESEAWDIVQMEEIERELLDGGNIEFEDHSEE